LNRTKTPRLSEVRPPLPDTLPHVPSLENLAEITVWLRTFRERLRIAHPKDGLTEKCNRHQHIRIRGRYCSCSSSGLWTGPGTLCTRERGFRARLDSIEVEIMCLPQILDETPGG
jgi:hypothetical protein